MCYAKYVLRLLRDRQSDSFDAWRSLVLSVAVLVSCIVCLRVLRISSDVLALYSGEQHLNLCRLFLWIANKQQVVIHDPYFAYRRFLVLDFVLLSQREMLQAIKTQLLRIVDDIDAGNSNIDEEEAVKIVKAMKEYSRKDIAMSKYQAYSYLNISRATFDGLVRSGVIPKGKKVAGFKELRWYKKDLDKIKKK